MYNLHNPLKKKKIKNNIFNDYSRCYNYIATVSFESVRVKRKMIQLIIL